MGAFEKSRMYRFDRGLRGARGSMRAPLVPILIGVAAALLITSRFDPSALAPARGWVVDWSAPVVTAITTNLAPVSRAWRDWQRAARSSEDAARIATLEMRLQESERENADLKRLARFVGNEKPNLRSARVLISSASPLSQTVLVDVGRNQGIKSGFPVVAGDGLLGRVVQAYAGQSSVMLLSDRLSRVPVAIGTSQARAVLIGNGSRFPNLDFLAAGTAISAGDLVTTSGLGGVFPRGLAVGLVAGDATGWRVELTAGRSDPVSVGILPLQSDVAEQGDPVPAKPERPLRQAKAPPVAETGR
jgi:rod shape-determining protein MreC